MLYRIAVRNVFAHLRQSALLGSAVAVAALLVTCMLSLAAGVQRSVEDGVTTLLSAHINLGGFVKTRIDKATPMVTGVGALEALVKKEVPELESMSVRDRSAVYAVNGANTMFTAALGLDLANEPQLYRSLKIREGKLESLMEPWTAVIFDEQARKLDAKVGDTITLYAPTVRGSHNAIDLKVGAIAKSKGAISELSGILTSNASLRGMLATPEDSGGAVGLYLKDPSKVREVHKRLEEVLRKAGYNVLENSGEPWWSENDIVARQDWVGKRLYLTNWQQEGSILAFAGAGLSALTLLLSFLVMGVISVGLMAAMWVKVRERSREIGAMRAMGMQRGAVVRLFLLEGAVLGALASVVGVVLALVLQAVLNAATLELPAAVRLVLVADRLFLPLTPWAPLGALVVITLSVTAIAFIPALKAARLSPRIAMEMSE